MLLHPRNAHMMFMPVIDDLLKKDAFQQIVIDGKGQKRDSTTFIQALTPQKNVEKAIHFIKSKLGVGVVALDITGHSVFGSQNINMNNVYFNPNEDFKPTPTSLLFEGLENEYSLSSMYDVNNRIISEVQAQTMNSQVDAGKDPYAVLLGINNQTLGIMMYLVRRRVPVITVLKFLSQPMIQQYLVEQRKNESVINKQRGREIDKKDLIENIYKANGLSRVPLNRTKTFSDLDLSRGIKKGVIDNAQINMFEYFLALVDETSVFNDLKSGITVDTKGKKDKAAVENFEVLWEKIEMSQIISSENLGVLKEASVLKPFFTAQKLYRQIYFPFYALATSKFGNQLDAFKDLVSSRQKGAFKKDKARTTIENDFLLFLIQNTHPDFNQETFDKLFGFVTKEKSLAIQIKDLMKDPVHSNNPVLKAFFPLLSITKDDMHKKHFDAIRLFERELSTIDLNDFIDAMKDIRDEVSEDLYKSIIQVGLYQAGFNNSPFSLNKIFPTFKSTARNNGELVDFQNDYLREIQISTLRRIPELDISMMDQFTELFFRNNPTFAPWRYSKYSPIKYFYTYDKTNNKHTLFYKADDKPSTLSIYPSVLGNTYFKRYFISNAMGLESPVSEPKVAQTEDSEYTEFEEVTNQNLTNQGTLLMQPDNIAKIKSGQKTITNRKQKFEDGIYKLANGTTIELTLEGVAKVGSVPTSGDNEVKVVNVEQDKWSSTEWLADDFAKAEGFKDWNDFEKNNKYSDQFIKGNETRYVYNVKLHNADAAIFTDPNQLSLFAELNQQELTKGTTDSRIIISDKKYSRQSVEQDSLSMYLFTDNAERTSAPKATSENIDESSWYYQKYKSQTNKPLHYGSLNNPTSAVIRGLENAYPISTMSAYGTNWTTENFDLFKDTIDDEIAQIKEDFDKFKSIKLGNFRIGQGGRYARLPQQHQDYLDSKLMELGIDNTGNIPTIIEETVRGTEEGSNIVNENQTDASISREMLLADFENYFPDFAHYNDAQREIVANSVERGELQITCKIGK